MEPRHVQAFRCRQIQVLPTYSMVGGLVAEMYHSSPIEESVSILDVDRFRCFLIDAKFRIGKK